MALSLSHYNVIITFALSLASEPTLLRKVLTTVGMLVLAIGCINVTKYWLNSFLNVF